LTISLSCETVGCRLRSLNPLPVFLLYCPMPLDELVEIMRRLRDPRNGCPWDLEQTPETLKNYLLEEAHEVVEAIDSGDPAAVREELGDLLFQIVFHAQIGREDGTFDMEDVIRRIRDKMIRRHPHVFGDAEVRNADDVVDNWEEIKKAEGKERPSLLDGVPVGLPALLRARRLQERAARVGFDWPDRREAVLKLHEELDELHAAVESGDPQAAAEELGDVLFMLVNLSRFLDVDPEEALRAANRKFRDRFRHIEKTAAATGRRLEEMTLAEMDALWEEAKREGG